MGDCFEGWEGDFCLWFKPSGLGSFSCIEEGEGLLCGFGAGVGGVGPARGIDRKSTRLNSSHSSESRMPSSA